MTAADLSSAFSESNSINCSLSDLNDDFENDSICFHSRSGSLIKLSSNRKSAERLNAYDEFNNGVVMTNRCLKDDEMFEIRIDEMVSKWSGSIEIGITTHNPDYLEFPQTMTNLATGTIMMSGCGILVNGKGSRREYGQLNLDELKSGDRVGLVRRSNNDLHYFINGCDQGVAATGVPVDVWAVIDLYGMTTKVTIVEHDNRSLFLEYNSILEDLEFDTICGRSITIGSNRKTAIKDSKITDLDNGVVFSSRPLFDNELFEIRLDNSVSQWWEDVEIGVTGHNPTDFGLPVSMLNFRNSKSWLTTGKALISKSNSPTDLLTVENANLQIGDRIGVMRSAEGELKFFVNGCETGLPGIKVPEIVYAILNLCCTFGQVTLLKQSLKQNLLSVPTVASLPTPTKTDDSTCDKDVPAIKPIPDCYKFSSQHGKNISIKSCGTLAVRLNNQANRLSSIALLPSAATAAPTPVTSAATVLPTLSLAFTETELLVDRVFEIAIVTVNARLAGNLRIGVCTKKQPFAQTVANLDGRVWYVSGCDLYKDHYVVRYEYAPNLNYLEELDRVSVLRTSHVPNRLRFGVNGQLLDVATDDLPEVVYVFVELYGACAAIKIEPGHQTATVPICKTSSASNLEPDLLPVSEDEKPELDASRVEFGTIGGSAVDENVSLANNNCTAERVRSYNNAMVFVRRSLQLNSAVEIIVDKIDPVWSSTLACGLLFDSEPCSNYNYNQFSLKRNCVLVTDEWIFANNTKMKSSYGRRLANITNGTLVAVKRTVDNRLEIALNGESFGELTDIDLPTATTISCQPLFNLYGQCVRITLHGYEQLPLASPGQQPLSGYDNETAEAANDEEKASLECAEKLPCSASRVSLSVSSSIFSNNNDYFAASVAVAVAEDDDDDGVDDVDDVNIDNPLLVSATSVKDSPSCLPCSYLVKSSDFFSRLFVPDIFLSSRTAQCFCINCYQLSSDDDNNNNSLASVWSPPIGWIRYTLRTAAALDTWTWAFYVTRPGLLRQILDLQHLLTEDEQTTSYFVRRDDAQHSTISVYTDFQTAVTKATTTTACEAFAIVQLGLRPGTFYPGNETGTIFLHESCSPHDLLLSSLLIRLADD